VWEISQPVLEASPSAEAYEPGSWGPEAVHDLIAPRHWHLPGHPT
jgi:glucose-6-phosphate 1-dehydrogenase